MKYYAVIFLILFSLVCSSQSVKVVKAEFIYETAPFPSCHASTIAETPGELVAAFFGGTAEGNPDVGIWFSCFKDQKWTVPEIVADGIQSDGKRYPCWNPVLYLYPKGALMLFYKVGPSPSEWWGMLKRSYDSGKTWTEAVRLPEGFMGPVKNKPVLLADGTLLCPSSTEKNGWQIQMEITNDMGKTWIKSSPERSVRKWNAIQPTILFYKGGRLQILCRTKEGCIAESWSLDNGKSWSPLNATLLQNPNSGIDAITLRDGRHLLVFNPVTTVAGGGSGPRTPLSVAITSDGKNWNEVILLETGPGEYSYPAVIQTSDGLVHITYTWNRKLIKHVIIKI
jgi:predicted neuraminidase